MRLHREGSLFRDEHGRQRILHGVNLVAKGERSARGADAFAGNWTAADLADLAARGLTVIRLGVIWAAVEPQPSQYDETYLGWLSEQLDLCAAAGLSVLLDAHQDLYSQSFGDGAPDWATLTEHRFDPSGLWSDGYLTSPAVQQALDGFWTNQQAADGIGVGDHFAAMWAMLAGRFGNHPAVIGYDLLNEPTPGRQAPMIFGAMISALAEEVGMSADQLAADFADPSLRVERLSLLDDRERHYRIGDQVAGLLADFETTMISPMMARVVAAIREVDHEKLIMREHSYFANSGVPAGIQPPPTATWAYSPHGYDLTVDIDPPASSNRRAETIFLRARETQRQLDVPVLVGEWGAFGGAAGIEDHGRFLLDLFDRWQWSWTYWCWEPDFASTEAAAVLTRPRPLAFAGTAESYAVDDDHFAATWQGADLDAPTLFWLPAGWADARVELRRDGQPTRPDQLGREGSLVQVAPGRGTFELRVDCGR
ncbi:glycoside hydrolase family 5 protein [Microlunatus elymi]|uniref:Glycoside hydrolase family 5 protein n=1 Tax=Microlunatus elymi TaxID=2596828 RepID=A0A516Q2Z8_9ACTN|nr:cellulase family glycosylhydrolase [Microlunatus elymi]QDP97800.1 glycoside hydrolase family 5 protein [Microlunatus elymi]